jgi:hypothetical protein
LGILFSSILCTCPNQHNHCSCQGWQNIHMECLVVVSLWTKGIVSVKWWKLRALWFCMQLL